jgi:CBS domain-containing protein
MLRLQAQLRTGGESPEPESGRNPNLIAVDALNDVDRRMLKVSLRTARLLRQRLQLDYLR